MVEEGFSHIVECSILNAYILDCDTGALYYVEELIGSFTSRKRAGRLRSGDHPVMGHWPQHSEKIRDCVVCNQVWITMSQDT